jgi:hypothetical protein
MNALFLVTLILLACLGGILYVLLSWGAKHKHIHHEKQLDSDDLLLHSDDVQFARETSFHFIEAARWPI